MSRFLHLCAVRTPDNAVKFFDSHDPIPAKTGGHVTLNLNFQEQTVAVRLCRRCGVAYVESESITYDKPGETAVTSPQSGNA